MYAARGAGSSMVGWSPLTWQEERTTVERTTRRPARVRAESKQSELGEGAMMNRRILVVLTVSVMGVIAVGSLGMGQAQDKPKLGFKDTPMLPSGRWHVHDGNRPQPPVVTPGTSSTQ